MIHPIAAAAHEAPEQILLVAGEREWASVTLCEAVQARAGGLRGAGLGAGDAIGLAGPPSADWLIGLHAIGWIGGVAVPLPHGIPLEAALEATEPVAVLAPAGTAVPHPQILDLALSGPAIAAWIPAPDSPRLCLGTSGTTGRAKAVRLSWGQLEAAAQASQARLGHAPDDAWLGCLPLHHIGGLSVFLRTARYGTTGVLHDRFDGPAVASALDSGAVTQVSLVPAMLRSVLDSRAEQPFHPRLRLLLIGGAPMPADLLDRCRDLDLPVALTWGMTEAASQIATRIPGDLRPEPDVGLPLPGVEVQAEGGLLVVTGAVVPSGRLHTRDRGCLDALGRVIVQGRGADLILSGGENIDPREVERTLEAHPAIAEAVVVPRTDAHWGQRPVAFLIPTGTDRPDLAVLRTHLDRALARFKHPDQITWLDQLPRGPLGKVRRSALVDQAQAGEAGQED